MLKATEDVKITTDGTVRNAKNNIIQFIWEVGMNPVKIEKQKLLTIGMSFRISK